MKLPTLLLLCGIAGLVLGAGSLAARGTADPVQTTYWANGQLQAQTEYRDGRPDGPSQRWHADGSKQAEGRYAEGRMEGAWTFWRADGTPDGERSGMYRAGIRQPSGG